MNNEIDYYKVRCSFCPKTFLAETQEESETLLSKHEKTHIIDEENIPLNEVPTRSVSLTVATKTSEEWSLVWRALSRLADELNNTCSQVSISSVLISEMGVFSNDA